MRRRHAARLLHSRPRRSGLSDHKFQTLGREAGREGSNGKVYDMAGPEVQDADRGCSGHNALSVLQEPQAQRQPLLLHLLPVMLRRHRAGTRKDSSLREGFRLRLDKVASSVISRKTEC